MVVEDDPDLGEVLSDVLTHAGYDVILARDGVEAINRFNRHAEISVILLDLMLPVLDGWQFLGQMRSALRHRGVPVVVLSAFSDTNAVDADAVLTKPATTEVILSTLARVMKLPSSAD
jgi:two-component system chemotaxis sensor kinase CheA